MRLLIMVVRVAALGAGNVQWIAASTSVGFSFFCVRVSTYPAFTLGKHGVQCSGLRWDHWLG